jgi:hypothetical protein
MSENLRVDMLAIIGDRHIVTNRFRKPIAAVVSIPSSRIPQLPVGGLSGSTMLLADRRPRPPVDRGDQHMLRW